MESKPTKTSSSAGFIETAENTMIGIGESMMNAPELLIGASARKDVHIAQGVQHPPSVDAAQGMKGALQDAKDDVSRIPEQISHTKEDVKNRLGERMEHQGETAWQKGVEMQGKSQVIGLGEQIKSISQNLNPFKEN